MDRTDLPISHPLKTLWFSCFKGSLFLASNQLTVTLITKIEYMTELGKLICTSYL